MRLVPVIPVYYFAYYVVGYEPAVTKHLALWYAVHVCHQYDVCKQIMLEVCMLEGMVI